MTNLLLLLGFALLLGAGVGVTLWRLLRPEPGVDLAAGEQEVVTASGSLLETYQPMNRLFVEEDFAFLTAHARFLPGIEKQLRRQRRQVLRLYLKELGTEFRRVYSFCRLLAPQSQNPEFAALITQQAMAFYGLLLILHVRCSLGWFLHVGVDTSDLVSAFDRLREAARASLLAMAPQPALASQTA